VGGLIPASSFQNAAKDNDLEKYFKVNHQILRATWEEETSKWYITIRVNNDPSTDFEDWCDFFVK
jgi:cation diffusion facilitator CzcD-associated flavoprotein CzcO